MSVVSRKAAITPAKAAATLFAELNVRTDRPDLTRIDHEAIRLAFQRFEAARRNPPVDGWRARRGRSSRPVPVMPDTHDGLAADLAACLFWTRDSLTWENVEMIRPTATKRWGGGYVCRPDVVALPVTGAKHAGRARLDLYEVKVTRADFRSDMRSGKWKAYPEIAGRAYFAAPRGLLDRKEIPDPMGLIERGPGGWRVRKQAADTGNRVTAAQLLTLMSASYWTHVYGRSIHE